MWPWTVSASGQYRDLKGWVNSCKWKQSCWHSNRSPLACWMLWIGIVSFVAIQQWKKGGSFQSQSTMPFCNAEDGAQGRLLKSMQNLLGRAKTIFERKALSWEVLLLSVPVQVGKRVRRRDGGGKCSPQHWEISCSVMLISIEAAKSLSGTGTGALRSGHALIQKKAIQFWPHNCQYERRDGKVKLWIFGCRVSPM